MSTLKTTNITHGSNSGTANMILASDGKVTIPEKKLYCPGAIVQVVQSVKTDTHAGTAGAGTFEDIGGTDQDGDGSVWCCKIIPTAATSKILVDISVNTGSSNWSVFWKLFRDSTALGVGPDLGGNRSEATFVSGYPNHADGMSNGSYKYLDDPDSTSELTYKIQGSHRAGSLTWKVNRSNNDGNYNYIFSTTSTITLMEVAGT